MKLTRQSIANPVAVVIVAAIVMVLGLISMSRMPASLLPNIEKPIMSVVNIWPGASPAELESEITAQVEEVLKGTPGMTGMMSSSNSNFGWMQLTFALETDMTRAMIDVISRLNRLRPLPSNAQKPTISMGQWGDSNDVLIEYFFQQLPGFEQNTQNQDRYLRDVVIPELQSVYGVSSARYSNQYGGTGDQLQIIFDPYEAAELGIDLAQVSRRIGRSSDISSGFVDVGSRQYIIRYEGRYDIDQLSDLILEWRDGLPIRLGSVARIEINPGRKAQFIYQNGRPAFLAAISRDTDSNVLESLDAVKRKIDELNAGPLKEMGLQANYSFDPSLYINRSIQLVGGNLIFGMILAVGVLWLFLRQWRATMLIAIAIPVSLLATFVLLGVAGRSLNVISLAGLAFASGMVLDAAIVVLENIVRLRERGDDAGEASDKGATQVWGALLASTVTTVAIFVPVMFLEDVAGQMFADLALTIAIGVSVSLIVAVTILPTAARYWMTKLPPQIEGLTIWDKMADRIIVLTSTTQKRLGWVGGLMFGSVALTIILWTPLNYLPSASRDSVAAFLSFPSGINFETADREIATRVNTMLEPHVSGVKEPRLKEYFMRSWPSGTGGMLSVTPADGTSRQEVANFINQSVIPSIPGLSGAAFNQSLFGGFSGQNSVEIRVITRDSEALKEAAKVGVAAIAQRLGVYSRAQPDPFAENTELRFEPNDRRLSEVGWSRQDLTAVILQLGQGAWMGEYFDGSDRLDIFLKSERLTTPEEMANLPVSTPLGGTVPLGELATIRPVQSATNIRRFDGQRGLEIEVNPPDGMTLEELIAILRADVEPQIMAVIPPGGRVQYAGNAEELGNAISELLTNFFMAFVLLVLILAGLFRSIKAALLTVVTIPMAIVGGISLFAVINLFAGMGIGSALSLDLLGLIGFVILLGLVVNNAILLVAQTRIAESRGLGRTDAVRQALRMRIRPIFMSTLTSLFGMLPLLLMPGTGSEIYRGMAAAIVGGMSVSTIFTLVLLPSLLQLTKSDVKRPNGANKADAVTAE